MPNLLQSAGSQDDKQTRFGSIWTSRFMYGLQTNRNALRGPGGVIYDTYYKIGNTDALLGGVNTEISDRLTIIRRPGCTAGLSGVVSSSNFNDVADSFYSFQEQTGTIRLFASGLNSVWLLNSTGAHTPIFTKNTATITNTVVTAGTATVTAANNFTAGQTVTITGSTNGGGALNGTFIITVATAVNFQFLFPTTIGTAADTGTATVSGQTYFQGVNSSLYFSDRSGVPQKWQDFGLGNPGNSLSPITATSASGVTATITATNNFQVGQTVVVSGTTNGGGVLNGSWVLTGANSQIFQFSFTTSSFGSVSDTGFASGTWNLGIVPPAAAPTLNIVASGSAAIQWVASTVFSTMGLIVDGAGNAQQVVSVNATGTNATRLGTTGNGQPAWNPALAGNTTDNTVTWQNRGPVGLWTPSTLYNNFSTGGTTANPCVIYDPATDALYGNTNGGGGSGTSGTTRPKFSGVNGSTVGDNRNGSGITWFCIKPKPGIWVASHAYTTIGSVAFNDVNCSVVEPIALSSTYNPAVQATIWQVATTGGTSGAGGNPPIFGTSSGQQSAPDGDLIWLCQGSTTRGNSTAYTAWTSSNPVFSVINVSSTLYVCTQSGTTAGSPPTFTTTYGDQITDGTVQWTCVGASMSWAAATQWYLPATGFQPPSGSQGYGGAQVVGSGFVQAVIISGKSQTPGPPSWSTTIGNLTTDGAATWKTIAAFSQNSISWTKGYGYVYSYKARSVSDQYSPLPAGQGLLPPGNPGLTVPFSAQIPSTGLGTPTGSADATVSSASPAVQMAVGPNSGSVVYVSGLNSPDPQVDTIVIFRTADGGATYFELTEIPNLLPIGGNAKTWTFQDFLPDTATATFPGLNTLVLAPLNGFSNPPLNGAINLAFHLGRLWYSLGNIVYASDGPLVGGASQPPGNGFTQFSPAQFFSFPSPAVRMVPTSTGLLNFGRSDVYSITGGPNFTQLAPNIFIPKLGLLSYNALAEQMGLIYVVSSDKRCISLDPNQGVNNTGRPIGDIVQALNPATAYLTFLAQGTFDQALFLGDGSTGWYRCNPNPSPDLAISGPLWSPKANIVGGAKAIAALQVAQGQNALLVGATTSGHPILVRDSLFTTFADNGSAYPANYIFGSIVLAFPGQIAQVGFFTCDFVKTGTSPKLSVLFDEITDTVLSITQAAQSGTVTTYTYTLTSGPAPVPGILITISGMADAGNNGTFVISTVGVGTFTVTNASGINRSVQTGTSTRFLDLSAYVAAATGLPPQESPSIFGLTSSPSSLYSNRYYMEQSVGGLAPSSYCRHLQMRIDYGSTDTVQNEILSQTIFGCHYNEI